MNIEQAKEQIKRTAAAYLTVNEYGEYAIPVEEQRPIFLIGAPGIGKTAIMRQVAEELKIGLVAYSMTHHTRQSALGLPYIVHKDYGGKEYAVSEYTMSEIIASVYDMIEETGIREGILFLDEINCVSETLAPSMLQFLQFKKFGRHDLPQGWIVAAAGNPPEYNASVREFDVVTLDRLKYISVEPDLAVWKKYAMARRVHPSILSYLEIRKDNFYDVETTVDGKLFVTPRGWEELSKMICLYELKDIPVDEELVSQYLHHSAIARDFAAYYDLFHKYKSDYRIEEILSGNDSDTVRDRAKAAKFDEKLALLGLIIDALNGETANVLFKESACRRKKEIVKEVKNFAGSDNIIIRLRKKADELRADLERGKLSGAMSDKDRHLTKEVLAFTEECECLLHYEEGLEKITNGYRAQVEELKAAVHKTGESLANVFSFCDEVFGAGQEVLILVTELTLSTDASTFISHYGCDAYFAHNDDLMFYERNKEIIASLEELEDSV